jgi:hypothetical protein
MEPEPPPDDPSGRVIALTRKRYAKPRAEVERELRHVARAAEKLHVIVDQCDELNDPDEDDLVS